LEESQLVEQAKAGDVHAFETLVKHYQDLAFRVAYLITAEPDEAEDAAQDALVKAYYALPRFRIGAPFRPWLLRIVANEAQNRRKAAGRRVGLALRVAETPGSQNTTMPIPEDTVLANEQRHELLAAVNRLREEDRLIIAYRYFLELTESEMAETLRCPRGTVKSRLSRALSRLREELLVAPTEVPGGSHGG